MSYKQLMLAAVCTVAASLAGVTTAAADVTVRMLHVEQNQQVSGFWNDIARCYGDAHPGVKIELRYLEAVSFVNKLPTLLQSSDRPNIIYSWGGGELREQVKAGVIEDLTPVMDAAWKTRFVPAAVQAYTVDNKIYGVPMHTSQVSFFYNKDLFAKAGMDASTINTWDDLLRTVKKLQTAGVTPIIAGGGDKWPLHFYWSHLAVRIGGKEAFEAALRGEGKGFADTTFVTAGELFKQLVELKPFQSGFLGTTYPQSAGQFGDGRGAMMLMLSGLLTSMKANAADKIGVPDDKLGWFPFPTVPGGKGDTSDTLGGLNGWLVTKGSPKETADFLRFFSEAENQRQAAKRGFYIPVVQGHAGCNRAPDPAANGGERCQSEILPDLL